MTDIRDIRRRNLKSLVDDHGLSVVARRVKRSATQINDTVAGRKSFGEKVARAIEKEWEPTAAPGWMDLDGGIDALCSDESGRIVTWGAEDTSEPATGIAIPQYDAAGRMGDSGLELRDQPGVIKSWTVSDEWLEQNVRHHTGKKNLCIVTGFGDSMRPMFNPGDPLIIDAGVKSVDFDGVYFFRVGNEGFIKRLQRVPGQGLLAISENESYRDWVIDSSMDFEVFGRVLKAWCSEEF